jgi:hypothetical protein
MAERFVELATTKYCSVAGSLTAEQTFEVVLEGDPTATDGGEAPGDEPAALSRH